MADIEPPSFSLGLDLEFDPPHHQQNHQLNDKQLELEELLKMEVSDSDPDSPSPRPTRLRRIRRGGPRITAPKVQSPPPADTDDIEDFSSEELVCADDRPASQHHSLCSSSKFPLSVHGVLTRSHESSLLDMRRKQDSSCPPSTSINSNRVKSVFPDITASPLRRFRLLDSDSDSEDMQTDKVSVGAEFPKTNKEEEPYHHGCCKIDSEKKIDSSSSNIQKQDLWKEFYVDTNRSIPTPVFDEFCEEYFKAGNQSKATPAYREFGSDGQGTTINNAPNMIHDHDQRTVSVPCHRYFFHDDLRIQRLVRSRLPYFSPLNTSGGTGDETYNASSINYMSQFGNGDSAKQKPSRQVNAGKGSKRAGKRTKKADLEHESNTSGSWINPKQTDNTPKDAGRKRVCTEGQSAGHWLTAENGKKVYVSRTGKELSGRLAYRHYKKENGGFRKSKQKRASKKKK